MNLINFFGFVHEQKRIVKDYYQLLPGVNGIRAKTRIAFRA